MVGCKDMLNKRFIPDAGFMSLYFYSTDFFQ